MFESRSFVHALKWAYAGSFGDRAISAFFYLILAGLLGPRDFGVVTLAMIYIGFLKMFLDQGLVTALIQRKELTQAHLNAVFWMDLSLSVSLVIISILFSRVWASYNHSPEIGIVAAVLSASIIFEALTIVQSSILQREMDFRSLSIRGNVASLIGGVTGIALAWKGAGVWALVCQVLVRDLIALVLLWKLARWRPSFSFSWGHLKELMGFSTKNFIAQLGTFADVQAAPVVLGIFVGPAAVGLYKIADKIVNTVVNTATTSIQVTSLPQFSRLQDNAFELKKSVVACIRISSTATLPALAGLAAVSHPLLTVIGPQWIPAADTLKVLCIVGMTIIFTHFTSPLLQALGKPHQVAVLEWTRALVGCITVGLAGWLTRSSSVEVQLLSIAVARLLMTTVFLFPAYIYFLLKRADVSLAEFTKSAIPSVVAAASVVACVWFLGSPKWSAEVVLFVEMALGGLAGVSTLLLVDQQLRRIATGTVKGLLGSN